MLAWRDVPTNNDNLGDTALEAEPDIWQLFVAPEGLSTDAFDRALYGATDGELYVEGKAGEQFAVRILGCAGRRRGRRRPRL